MRCRVAFALGAALSVASLGDAVAQSRPASEQEISYTFSGDAASIREIYTVRDIAIDEVAETAAAARRTAIRHARRIALARLLRRITLAADRQLIPDPTDAQLADLVAGFEVAGEKSSGTRYLGQLTIRFDEDRMRALLRRAGARFSETAAKPLLVVPTYEAAGARALWEQPNPWKSALAAAIAEEEMAADGLLPLRLPRGDLQDLLMLSADQAIAGDTERLMGLAARYGLENLLVTHAALSFDARTGNPKLTVTTRREGSGDLEVEVAQFDAEMGRDIAPLAARAARALVRRVENGWKQATWLDFAAESDLVVTTPLTSLSEWQLVRGRLQDTSRIRRVALRALSVQHANILVTYLGTVDQLEVALAQRGLELVRQDGYWLLRQPVR